MTEPRPDPQFEQLARQMSDEEIESQFHELLLTWINSEASRRRLDELDRNTFPPEPLPAVIEEIETLIEYNRRKWEYEQTFEEAKRVCEITARTYENIAKLVTRLIPTNHALVFEAFGDEYLIRNEDDRITVQKRTESS